jgi:hypothetical protein
MPGGRPRDLLTIIIIVAYRSAIGYVTPQAKLEGREEEIFKERAAKLSAARMARQNQRQPAKGQAVVVIASAITSLPG